MGSTIKISCNNCGYNRCFFIGFGLYDDDVSIFYGNMPQLFKKVLNPETRITVRSIMKNVSNARILKSEHTIYHCSYCNNLEEHYFFRIVYEDIEYSPTYFCTYCETKMNPLNSNWITRKGEESLQFFDQTGKTIELFCRKCRNRLFYQDTGFDWD